MGPPLDKAKLLLFTLLLCNLSLGFFVWRLVALALRCCVLVPVATKSLIVIGLVLLFSDVEPFVVVVLIGNFLLMEITRYFFIIESTPLFRVELVIHSLLTTAEVGRMRLVFFVIVDIVVVIVPDVERTYRTGTAVELFVERRGAI